MGVLCGWTSGCIRVSEISFLLNKAFPIWTALLIAIVFLAQCQQAGQKTASIPDKPVWWNHADSVGYVGIETCKNCHYDIYQSYRETGMGRSFGRATAQRSAMDSGHMDLFDSIGQWSYRMHVGSDGLFLRESRSVGTDTLHRLSQKVDYIIGSGQHTNSHLMDRMGYIHQMPVHLLHPRSGWPICRQVLKMDSMNASIDRSAWSA
jgi:hypothetical protein